MLHMLQWLYTYVASFCSQCFICFLKTYVAIVFIWMLHMFHTYVASVLFRCCICFATVFKCPSCVFTSVLDACFKCFICLYTYVGVASGCFKSRSDATSSSSLSAASPRCLVLLPAPVGHPPPLPLCSMLVMFGATRPRVGARNDCRRGRPDAPSVWMFGS
jgi:hypothetical protein